MDGMGNRISYLCRQKCALASAQCGATDSTDCDWPPVLTAGAYLIGETDAGGTQQFSGHFFVALESITAERAPPLAVHGRQSHVH